MYIDMVFDKFYNGEKNFMTPVVYEYSKKDFGDECLLFEKSKGEGIFNEEIFGCTVLVYNNSTRVAQRIELSDCFGSMSEVDEYIESIDEVKFENAKRYGELKKC